MSETDLIVDVAKAIAEADGVGQEELDPLYRHIDLEMIENLTGREKGEWRFTFQYVDHQVTITQDEEILIDGELYIKNGDTIENIE